MKKISNSDLITGESCRHVWLPDCCNSFGVNILLVCKLFPVKLSNVSTFKSDVKRVTIGGVCAQKLLCEFASASPARIFVIPRNFVKRVVCYIPPMDSVAKI